MARQFKKTSSYYWSDHEIKILKKYGPYFTCQELTRFLPGRSHWAIQRKRVDFKCYPNPEAYRIKPDDLPEECLQVLIGSLLGDGCIKFDRTQSGLTYRFEETHGEDQVEYIKWKQDFLFPFGVSYCVGERNQPSIATRSNLLFKDLRQEMYTSMDVGYKHHIPFDLVKRIDYLGLLIWYLDNGSLGNPRSGMKQGKPGKPCPLICAHAFDYDELCEFVKIINDKFDISLNVKGHPDKRDNDRYPKYVRINKSNRKILLPEWRNLAEKYKLPQEMNYKLNLHIPGLVEIENIYVRSPLNGRLDELDVDIANGMSYDELAKKYNCSKPTILMYKRGVTHKDRERKFDNYRPYNQGLEPRCLLDNRKNELIYDFTADRPMTTKQLAQKYDCSTGTIEKYKRRLRENGELESKRS